MLDKTYRPEAVERAHYQQWEESGAFAAGGRPQADPYTIVIPPPNVTGSLHMGHALNSTIQDVLIRYRRMTGRDTLWQPGMDHAGIATQMVVERQLATQGAPSRRELGREAFVERIWEWKRHSGGAIAGQLRRLGASCDWSRERFTMDEGLSHAVRKVFVDLHREGLIYRDKRLVNWDPALETAISDLEVLPIEQEGQMWYFRYPLADANSDANSGPAEEFLIVGTTRPETMLGDSGVAVHPDDPRHAGLVGRECLLPLVGRRIPVVADSYADPEQGSGAVKITPAHDFNDFEVGRRHGLDEINVMTPNGCMNDNAPEKYRGLDRFAARDAVVADMRALGLLVRVETITHTVPHGDRGGVPIEPYLTDQWYVDAGTLAGPAIAAVESGRTRFVPDNWRNTYFEWMHNIRPWCVSRQLWWGHRIPAWYGPDGTVFVAMNAAEAEAAATAHYGKAVSLTQDQDVLDTWFSSALWPFSTLGWPEETPELARHYPTDVLVTGFDIIFFWVARMMMMGLHFMGREPFHTVHVHALVRDEAGRKMSKSRGNVIDPLELIDRYGADSLRFTLMALAVAGRDVKLSEGRVAGYRNFMTKLWNAARFCALHDCKPVADADFRANPPDAVVNRWILGELGLTRDGVTEAIENYRFNEAAGTLYRFVRHDFCDWYLEFAKPLFQGDDADAQRETRAVAAFVLGRILQLLHPIAPFVTAELWQHLHGEDAPALITCPWPEEGQAALEDEAARDEMDWIIRLISSVRSVRSEMNVPAGAWTPLKAMAMGDAGRSRLARHEALITRLARCCDIDHIAAPPPGAVQLLHDEATLILPLADVIDLAEEARRLARESDKIAGEIRKLEAKLANKGFLDKAPADVVAENRARLAEKREAHEKLHRAGTRLATALSQDDSPG